MRHTYSFLFYPIGLFLICFIPAGLIAALLHQTAGIDVRIPLSFCSLTMCLCYGLGKRRTLHLHPIPWIRMALLCLFCLGGTGGVLVLLGSKALSTLSYSYYVGVAGWSLAVAALAEECLFREYLLTRMRTLGWSFWKMTLLSAVLFSLCHQPESWSLFWQRLILGFLLAWLYYKTDDLALCVAAHWTYNAILCTVQQCYQELEEVYSLARIGLIMFACGGVLLGTIIVFCLNKVKFARL